MLIYCERNSAIHSSDTPGDMRSFVFLSFRGPKARKTGAVILGTRVSKTICVILRPRMPKNYLCHPKARDAPKDPVRRIGGLTVGILRSAQDDRRGLVIQNKCCHSEAVRPKNPVRRTAVLRQCRCLWYHLRAARPHPKGTWSRASPARAHGGSFSPGKRNQNPPGFGPNGASAAGGPVGIE